MLDCGQGVQDAGVSSTCWFNSTTDIAFARCQHSLHDGVDMRAVLLVLFLYFSRRGEEAYIPIAVSWLLFRCI